MESQMKKMPEYVKGDVVLITSVDLYGMCGRQEHPGPEHVGLTGEVVESRLIDVSMLPNEPEPPVELVRICTFGDTPVMLEMVEWEITRNTRSS